MTRLFFTALCFLMLSTAQGQMNMEKAFVYFDEEGNSTNANELLKAAQEADIIFFGELHNNPISHWLQLELVKALHASNDGKIILGAEMFEADNQLLMDEYLKGTIPVKNFEQEARLWNNYQTDYKPLVEFAKANGLHFAATNIPRRYANLVFREGMEGLEALNDEAKRYIAPLPFPYDADLPGYKKMIEMMGGHGGPSTANLPKAQASKDATMAHFIKEAFKPDHKLIHFNGAYHSDYFDGINWYLKQYAPDLKIMTISTVEQEVLDTLQEESKGKANFIIAVPANMTKTY
ncbi:MAG: ChaN family lipoprotein [Bacteroidota bacterium]